MTWIMTASGQQMDMRFPRQGAVLAADIAHHLAQINRFNGAAARPYSVAEHSLLVLEIVERMFQLDVHGRLYALMHDAHEAYTQDVTSPAKAQIDGWHAFEAKHQRTVRSAFALHSAAFVHAEAVHQADLIALATERAQLLPPGGPQWEVLQGVEPVGWIDLMDRGRASLSWMDWRQAWLDHYEGLDHARNATVFAVAQP
ncbi:HD family hydrolase [Aquincola sp. J276]|uniref:HD family hydrolase n=1 Tax=Aquincola sp. J276 TaxID=2898432 RepID=UPI0021512676|nr:HD family hydrolase [Aquincola sp. J276]MCR5864676.1 HD family hydrolase [Aquincola sp. J276]